MGKARMAAPVVMRSLTVLNAGKQYKNSNFLYKIPGYQATVESLATVLIDFTPIMHVMHYNSASTGKGRDDLYPVCKRNLKSSVQESASRMWIENCNCA